MGQIPTIKLNREFSLVYRKGNKVHTHSLILHVYERRKQSGIRLGVAVSHSIRTAVERNRLKRLLREAFRHEVGNLRSGYDIILTGKDLKPRAEYRHLVKDLRYALRRANLYRESEANSDSRNDNS